MSDPTTAFPLEHRTLGEVISSFAGATPDKLAVISPEGMRVTYAALDAAASRYAHGIACLGVEKGHPVLIMLPDVVDYLFVVAGLARRGAVEVPVNLSYKGAILAHICNESRAGVAIVARDLLGRIEEIASELLHLKQIIIWDAPAASSSTRPPAGLIGRFEFRPFSDLSASKAESYPNVPVFHDMLAILFTSGTTGPSKGVMVSHAQAFMYTYKCAQCYEPNVDSVLYSAGLPMFHCAGQFAICYAAFMYGATVVLRNGYRNEYFWRDVREYGCTGALLMGAVGTFLWKEPPRPEDRDHQLKAVLMAPVIANHGDFTKRFGIKIGSAYGSTELPPVSVLRPGDEVPSRACTGSIQDDYDVRILDEWDRELPMGAVGEICVRPKNSWSIATGYWMRPEATAKAFRNLWFHTGDAGYVDDQRRLYFFDRLTDSMRRRGENVSATEVEQEILKHEAIGECAVYPVWDENTEQEIMAAVVPAAGVALDFASMVRWLGPRLPYFMIPRYWRLRDSLPRTANGKVRKIVLREEAITLDTWDRVAAGVKLDR